LHIGLIGAMALPIYSVKKFAIDENFDCEISQSETQYKTSIPPPFLRAAFVPMSIHKII